MAYVLGVDGGIASVGWALLDDQERRIVDAGAWCFDAPENPKNHTLLNAERRQHRGQRRVIRRRRQRMAKLRQLFAVSGLLDETGRHALAHRAGCDPWILRARAFERALTGPELALALGHIARHRGFQSNSKRDRGANAPSDTSVMLKAVADNADRLQGRTVAQMALSDPDWQQRKRNRGDYARTLLRDDLRQEAKRIFVSQRRLGSTYAAQVLEAAYMPLAFDQRPIGDSENKVGSCSHEPSQRRTAKRAPSFEAFRLLARLRNLRLITAGAAAELTSEQIATAMEGFGKMSGLTFRQLRKRLDLVPGARFDSVSPNDEGRDVAARVGGAAEGTHALRCALGEAGWRALAPYPEQLDRAAEILSFREDLASIETGLLETGMEPWCGALLARAAQDGRFGRFRGAAHISAKAARAINQGLRLGLPVHEAFAHAGYDHATRPATDLESIANPTARKALGQMLRQIKAVVREHRHLFGPLGLPDRIHIELARDIGKSQEKRDEITRDIEKRTRIRDALRRELRDLFVGHEPSNEDVLRYELWKEQGRSCLYTGTAIPPAGILATDNSYQVDHILPWSRFGDDSYRNKSLVSAKANQDKKNRTPCEWLGESSEWVVFVARVESCKEMSGGKKAGFYLRRNAAEVEERFRTRNLNDTRYACRLLLDTLARWYPSSRDKAAELESDAPATDRRVFARPGALTSKLRQAWGLEGKKKGADGKRLADDRHHALDAIVVAACSESLLNRLTGQVKQSESAGLRRPFADVPQPWDGFRQQAEATLARVFVARPERCRARGEVHAATIRQVRERDGRILVYERKAVEKLTLKDLCRVKDGASRNAPLVAALRDWIEAGKPTDVLPRSHKHDVIRKVRLETRDKQAVCVRGGNADRGDMARVDVFREDRPGKPPRFHLVPIYPHQIADPHQIAPPDQATIGGKDEPGWQSVKTFRFMFSLFNNSLIEVVKPNGEVIMGYRKSFDRNTANLDLADHTSQQRLTGFGPKTLISFRKLAVSRLGRISHVAQEVRTWRGVACI